MRLEAIPFLPHSDCLTRAAGMHAGAVMRLSSLLADADGDSVSLG